MMKRRIVIVLMVLVMLASMTVTAQDGLLRLLRWSPPTTGSPAAGYELAHRPSDSPPGDDLTFLFTMVSAHTDTFHEMIMPVGESVVFVVRAYDAHDRLGPWSGDSEVWFDDGPPGGCSIVFW